MEKYEGKVVEIIYQSKDGEISQRRIKVRAVKDSHILAYCFDRKAPRVFAMDRILASQLVGRQAG